MLALNRRDYTLLGKLLCQQKPDVAIELSSQLTGETDLSKLSGYFSIFCILKNLNPNQIQGALFKSSLIENRRLFLGAILSIYNPHTRALSISLANLLKMDKSLLRRQIDETNVRYRAYHDFRSEVDLIVTKMKGGE